MTKKDPWAMSTAVAAWISKAYPEAMIVELGGGTGSQYLHRVCSNVHTIEHHPKWAKVLEEDGVEHSVCHLTNGWYDLSGESKFKVQNADVVVVAGPPGRLRTNVFKHLYNVKPGAVVVFDDAQRPQMDSQLQQLEKLQGWGYVHELVDTYGRATRVLQKPHEDTNQS